MFRCGIRGKKMQSEECALHCCDEKKKPDEVHESELCPGLYVECEEWIKDDARRAIFFGTDGKPLLIKHKYSCDERYVFMAWYGYFKGTREIDDNPALNR